MKFVTKWLNLSKKKKAYLVTFTVVVGVLLWAFVSAGVITHNFTRDQLQTGQDKQEALVNGLILTETKNEHKFWEIYGETGTYTSDNEIALLDNCIGNFYDANDEVSMSFESSKGTYNAKNSQIIMYNNTRIVIKDGTSLNADRLVWTGSDKPVIAKGNVKITRNKEFLATADMVEISPDYEKFKILGHAKSQLFDIKEKK